MHSISNQAVQELSSTLSSSAQILTPSSEGYSETLTRWSCSAEKQAGLVVLPTTAQDVAKAVRFSVQNRMELAVGGGMHGFFSSTQGGMSLNLSKMNQVSVDSEAMTLTVEGGALWADVDEVASKHNLAVVGGTINFVGVGGLTLGGGYGYLSGAHGLVIDNLLSVELVLASGEIVTASETQNQDLFWAVRGAGASFAVATKFVFRAHEQKSLVWGGTLRFSKSQLREVVDFANHTLEISQGEASMMVGFSTMNATAEASVVAVVFYNGSEDAAKNFYAKLLALKPSFNDTAMVPYSAINSWHNASVAYGSRHANKGAALLTPVQPNFVESLFEEYQSFIENVHDANKTLVLFDFFGYKKIMQVPQTATAFANRGALVNVLFAPAWDNKFNDLSCQEWTLAMAKKTQVEMEKQRADRTDDMTLMAAGEYMNYDGLGTSSAEKVFGVNFERLVTLKRQFDPENVFKTGHDLLPGVQVAARLAVEPERVTSSLFLTRGRNVATVA